MSDPGVLTGKSLMRERVLLCMLLHPGEETERLCHRLLQMLRQKGGLASPPGNWGKASWRRHLSWFHRLSFIAAQGERVLADNSLS